MVIHREACAGRDGGASLGRRLARFLLVALVPLVAVGRLVAVLGAPVVRAWGAGMFSAAGESLPFSLANQARASPGLVPLRWDSVLAGDKIGWDNAADHQATPMIEQMFMNSPEHRSNILGAQWHSMNVGAHKGTDGKVLYCVLFKESKPVHRPTHGPRRHPALHSRAPLHCPDGADPRGT